ncbi:hypothetical protein HK102_003509, partial [Quaeritorhiza haematococci]
MFGRIGGFLQCIKCQWRHPDFGHFAVASSEYPALHQQFYNITINNTHYNSNRNQEVQGQPELEWNQFKEDGVVVVEDSRTNDLLLGALSGTNQRVVKLANHLFGKHFALADYGTWYSKAAFENPAAQVVNRDRKVNKIQDVINKLETAAFKNAVIEELGSTSSREIMSNPPKTVFVRNDGLDEEIRKWKMCFMHILLAYYQVYKREQLERSGTIEQVTDEWIGDNDPLADFIAGALEFGDSNAIHTKFLWEGYGKWRKETSSMAREINDKKVFINKLKPELESRGARKSGSVRMTGIKNPTRGWYGVVEM